MVNVLFRLLTIYLLVPWLLLLLLPKSVLTRKLLLDRRYWLGVGGLYFLALFFFAWDVNWLQFLLPTTEGIREAFQHENLPLFVWIHMVAVNLFMGTLDRRGRVQKRLFSLSLPAGDSSSRSRRPGLLSGV